MNKNRELVVIKVGSGVITSKTGQQIDQSVVAAIASQLSHLLTLGIQPILVSSGAVAAGLKAQGIATRPTELAKLQAAAALGQVALINAWQRELLTERCLVAQILLTNLDFKNPDRLSNLLATIGSLTKINQPVVPVINENDVITTDELTFGDNDYLSAQVAVHLGAKKLLIISTVPGLLDQQTQTVIPEVADLNSVTGHICHNQIGGYSIGGMESKLAAVRFAVQNGIQTRIIGRDLASEAGEKVYREIAAVVTGEKQRGTLFSL